MPKGGPRSAAADARKRILPSASAPGMSADISVGVAGLFDRVAAILERARAGVVRSLNSEMVLAYWHIGREIVHLLQGGDDRAEYGRGLIDELSTRLTKRYGKGFSTTSLRYFRTFYQVYADRAPEIRHMGGGEFGAAQIHHTTGGVLEDLSLAVEKVEPISGFSALLGWSHYRSLMKVASRPERLFYEIEAEKEGWSVATLERQIHSLLFARLLKSRDKAGVMELATRGQVLENPVDSIRDPYVLDFLNLPDDRLLHESELEVAIIGQLQEFLLELGKGFAFVGRQKRLSFEDTHLYVDLVFYNCILKCFVLIDLKIGKLTHQDVGQMDGYVRLFDDQWTTEGDNPTVGLILCAEKNEAVAKYSVLSESRQIFAAKYVKYLPTEEELERELQRERRLIEEGRADAENR
jgi:predicted nuclease of restriction endonuclease-like (RecB) superfamily